MAPELQYDTEQVKVHSLGRFGTIRYVDLPRGYIKIVNDFFQKNMVKVELPFVGERWIHKEMKEPLLKVLNHIVHVSQYDPEWEYDLYFIWALIQSQDVSFITNAPDSYKWLIEATAGNTEIRSAVLVLSEEVGILTWEIS